MDLIQSLYFSSFIFSIIVFIDVLFKLKRPLILKVYLWGIILGVSIASITYSFDENPLKYYYIIVVAKAIIAFCFLNIMSTIYFKKYKYWTLIIGLILILITIYSFFYFVSIDSDYLLTLKGQTLIILKRLSYNPPLFIKVVRYIVLTSMIVTLFYFAYLIIIKFKLNNIYFYQVKNWTICITTLAFIMFAYYFVPESFLKNEFINHLSSITFNFLTLLTIFYRPNFLNKSSLKIGFGDTFKKSKNSPVNNLEFINAFFSNCYYINPDANIKDLSIQLNVSAEVLYNYIYNNYSQSFNDLVNQYRIEYFLDIIYKPKYQNYTIDALAKEVGFSSRNHLYKPFKKFHGGNPSDLLEAMKR
jgi:AraC-like DNA-binding protein